MLSASAKRKMDKPIEYAEIYAAVYKLSGALFTMEDVNSFLTRLDVNKDNSTRFLCWLISFQVISPDHEKWSTELYNLYQKYMKVVETKIADPANPLNDVSSSSGTVIECDLMRGMSWFGMMANDLKLSEFYTKDAQLRTTRILCALTLSVSGFSYCQGYDRYMFVTYILALEFCSQSGLQPQFAESMAFFLVDNFVRMTHISRYLENATETEEHFDNMDRFLMNVVPEQMKLLKQVQQGSIHFALRWELLLFADEYDVKPLMLLWDQMLFMKDRYKDFLFGLCVAHIKQVPVAGPDEIMVEKIQQFRSWNLQKIISDAFVYMNTEEKSPWRFVNRKRIMIALLILIAVLFVLSNLKRE